MWTTTWALICKDLQQNGKAFLLFLASAVALPPVFTLIQKPGSGSSGFIGVVFGYLVLSAPMLFAFWLVGQEKVKGTFRLLRLLPGPAEHIILTKGVASLSICVLTVNVVLVIEPLLLNFFGLAVSFPAGLTLLWMNLATAFFAALGIVIFTVFNHKMATQIWYLALVALMMFMTVAEKYLTRLGVDLSVVVQKALTQRYLLYWGAVLILLLILVLLLFAARYFEWRDWTELTED